MLGFLGASFGRMGASPVKQSAGAPLALDGHVSANTSVQSNPVTLTTTGGSGVIIVGVISNATSVTSVTAVGLTFTARGDGGGTTLVKTYSAPYTTNFSGTITVLVDSDAFTTVTAFGISGAKTSNFFDPNLASPAQSDVVYPPVTTTNANDFIFVCAAPADSPDYTAGAGWTLIDGTNFSFTEYQIVSATQANLTPTQGGGNTDTHGAITDAIVRGP